MLFGVLISLTDWKLLYKYAAALRWWMDFSTSPHKRILNHLTVAVLSIRSSWYEGEKLAISRRLTESYLHSLLSGNWSNQERRKMEEIIILLQFTYFFKIFGVDFFLKAVYFYTIFSICWYTGLGRSEFKSSCCHLLVISFGTHYLTFVNLNFIIHKMSIIKIKCESAYIMNKYYLNLKLGKFMS